MTRRLFRVEAKHMVAGGVVGEIAAPIIWYMRKWSEDRIKAYCTKKGWQVEFTDEVLRSS